VEQTVRGTFTANDVTLEARACLLLTGPNMAGKSTLMRQVALMCLLAQAGSYVPAQRARLPLLDAIYTRIGASDQLSEGLSTFMVEMTETAQLLREATERSLVILDEVGRGTSTYDGMSLAQALLEHLLSDVKCLTLFATHYHELTGLESLWPQIRNVHMSVVEKGGEIRFLHSLTRGPALKSYGIQVANLAGLPAAVTRRAQQILRDKEHAGPSQLDLLASGDPTLEEVARTVAAIPPEWVAMIHEIREAPVAQMTPLDALNRLAGWRDRCRELS
jgi:DNA mismatch repair protein MutS